MDDHATDVALFRYSLVRALIDESLSKAERGRAVRALAERAHTGPGGFEVQISRPTLDRWVRLLRAGGFEALKPEARHANPRTPAETLALAERLRRERPERTAAHICELIRTVSGWAPDERTIQRHFVRVGLSRRETRPKVAFGRFEAERPNELWTGDALHGPVIGGRKTYLFAFIDDHSRAFCGYRWGYAEDTVRLEAALRQGIERRGVPRGCYLDNGSAMVSRQLLRALAVLGTKLTHSAPGRPEGRGKIERAFGTSRTQTDMARHRRRVSRLVARVRPGIRPVGFGGGWTVTVRGSVAERDAQADLDLPSRDPNLFDDEAEQALSTVEVELVQPGRGLCGKVAETLAESVLAGEVVVPRGELAVLGFELGSAGGCFFGAAAELCRGDEVSLVEVGDTTAFGVDLFDPAGELGDLGREDLVVARWFSPGECLFAGEEHVRAGEHGSDLIEHEGVELVGADAPLGAALVLAAGL